jgi:serine/threonine-protein kinase PpkA
MEIPGYRIHGEIGHGGMAKVYLATQESFGRQVAIKVMASELVADPDYARRFHREAKIIAGLNHPHIVPVYDVGQSGDCHYLAMEFVGGGSLKERIRNGMQPPEAERMLREIADALEYAGQQGFVHRDVKPDNIMFRDSGSAVLMDFGIARPRESEESVTRMGTLVGTPKYMSPEQFRGRTLDTRADLYALGAVFFEMLAGHPPFTGNDPMAIGMAHLQEPVPRLPPEVGRYQPVIDRLLAKEPDDRYASAGALLQALEALDSLAGIPDAAPAPGGGGESSAEPQTGAEQPKRASFVARDESQIRLEPRLRTQEVKEKAGLWSRRLIFDVYLVADDFEQFRDFFEQITRELYEWGQQHGKKCGGVRFKATIHPWIAGRVKEYIRNLRKSDSHAFMQRVPVRVNLVAADSQPLEQYELAPETDTA